ncbi:putative bifunctional diguanylate cyclase/phosphodiesterase [Qipengyuania atrilutea]|uniref:EAL domain-containing protein n=1 Tax=Qipengyuania atrilutea TaxID=2744473 RepID=A0A850H948_9SPHN|nr:EAL domain-containing protein [Actirhodobacter atriluteus]NVD43609.1 EAL domain-containing protein [Actirhodobacter atriluteus]
MTDKAAYKSAALKRATQGDIVTLAIAGASILLFAGSASIVIPQIIAAFQGHQSPPDILLANALLLNIALIGLGWRRYNELNRRLKAQAAAARDAKLLADTDPLTGSLNRRSGIEVIDRLMSNCQKSGSATAIILIDLDNFKRVNDSNGHRVGDDVLRQTVRRIEDLLPIEAKLARIGGDEFVCALPYAAHQRERIEMLAFRMLETLAKPFDYEHGAVELTISVGIASNDAQSNAAANAQPSQPEKAGAQLLIHRADLAMYHAKNSGKNRYAWFDEAMERELVERQRLERGLREGLRLGQFRPFYEQQIDLDSGDLLGFEMLARWRSPELGEVSPEIFIPLAEKLGLIDELSEGLIAQALADARDWAPHLTLSINISPIQLRDQWFSHRILKLLVQNAFPPSRLDLEITESCLHEDLDQVRSVITSLRNQGVRFSIDDFGTGYSSLLQLKNLPVDRLKIDRSFVSSLTENGEADAFDTTIVDAILSLGEGFKMPITAEGIATPDILEALKRRGRMAGQGYHYGMPENADQVRNRLAKLGLLAQSEASPAHPHEPKTEVHDLAHGYAERVRTG